MGQGRCSQQMGRCQKQANSRPYPDQLHLQPLSNKIRAPDSNIQLLHTSSNAKTHNTKVIAFFKTNPTM